MTPDCSCVFCTYRRALGNALMVKMDREMMCGQVPIVYAKPGFDWRDRHRLAFSRGRLRADARAERAKDFQPVAHADGRTYEDRSDESEMGERTFEREMAIPWRRR